MWSPWDVWLLVVLIVKSTHMSPRNSLELTINNKNVPIEDTTMQGNHLSKLYNDIYNSHINIIDNNVYEGKENKITKRNGKSYSYKDSFGRSRYLLNSRTKRSISDYDYNYNSMYISNEPILDFEKSLESTEYKDYFTSVISKIPIKLQVDNKIMEKSEMKILNYDSIQSTKNTEISKDNDNYSSTEIFKEDMHYDDSSKITVSTKRQMKSTEYNDTEQSENISYIENSVYYKDSLDNSKSVINGMEYSPEIVNKDGQKYENGVLMALGTRTKRSADDTHSDEKEEDNYLETKAAFEDSSEKADADIKIKASKGGGHSADSDEYGIYYSLEWQGKGIELGGDFTEETTDDELNEKYKRKSRNFFEGPLDPLAEQVEENKNKKITANNNDEENTQENNDVENSNMTQNADTSKISKDVDTSVEYKVNSKKESQENEDVLLDNGRIKNHKEKEDSVNNTKHLNESEDDDKVQKHDPVLTALENIPNIEVLEVNTTDSVIKPNSNKKIDGKSHIQNKNNKSQKVKKNTHVKKVHKSYSKKTKQNEPIDKEKVRIHTGSKYINFMELDKMLDQRNQENSSINKTEKSLRDSKSNSSENAEEIIPERNGADINDNHKMVVNEKMSGKNRSEKDFTITYNINNNKIISYNIRDLYKDNKHILDSIQNSIKAKEYRKVNLILNLENNTIELNKETHKPHKSGKSLRNTEDKDLESKHKSPKNGKKKKRKRKKEKKEKIKKSRETKEIKFDPYLVPGLTGWRGQHDHQLQSGLGNGISYQQQLPMKFYFPNSNSYSIPYINTPTSKNRLGSLGGDFFVNSYSIPYVNMPTSKTTRSLGDDFFVLSNGIVIDNNKSPGVVISNDLHSLGGLNNAKPQEGPFDRGKPLLSGANIKKTLQAVLDVPAVYDRRSYGRSVKEEDQNNVAEDISEDVAGYWILPNYNPGNTGYWLYPAYGVHSDQDMA